MHLTPLAIEHKIPFFKMKSKLCTCTMETASWFLVIICAVLIHNTSPTNCAPTTEINSPGNDHVTGIYPTATIAPTSMSTMTMTSAKSWSSQKPSRSKHITKSSLYKKPSKDKGGWAKVPFISPTLVPTGYDVEKDISHYKEATAATTTVATAIDTVVDNVNGPKDYTNKNSTNATSLRHLTVSHSSDRTESNSHTNVNSDVDSGKDIDSISDSSTTKADETYATTEGYHAKTAAPASSSTTAMQSSLVENPDSNVKPIPNVSMKADKANEKSISSPLPMTYTPMPGKSFAFNASLSLFSQQNSHTTTILPPTIKLDVGHDGVKVTKKKQLFDKHFIAAASSPSGSLHPLIGKDNPWPSLLSKNKPKPTKGNGGGLGGKKLMEVPNGYLGPIMMKEKTFSVLHHGKKPKPSIVEQLKDKKLVEIIAPTALMEPVTKVKSSVLQPDFVAVDSISIPTSTVSTTTESVSSSHAPDVPKLGKNKKKEIESETATTYFLVVTQETQSLSQEVASETIKPPLNPEMEPMNSGEIESTLREIYAEVINAMEGGSKAKVNPTKETDQALKADGVDSSSKGKALHEASHDEAIDLSSSNKLLSSDTDFSNQNRGDFEPYAPASQSPATTEQETTTVTSSNFDHEKLFKGSELAVNGTGLATGSVPTMITKVLTESPAKTTASTDFHRPSIALPVDVAADDLIITGKPYTHLGLSLTTAFPMPDRENLETKINFTPRKDHSVNHVVESTTYSTETTSFRIMATAAETSDKVDVQTNVRPSFEDQLKTITQRSKTTPIVDQDSSIEMVTHRPTNEKSFSLSEVQEITFEPLPEKVVPVVDESHRRDESIVADQNIESNYTTSAPEQITSTKNPPALTTLKHFQYTEQSSLMSTSSPIHEETSFYSTISPVLTTLAPIHNSISTISDSRETSSLLALNIPNPTANSAPAESKISDIQIEVYDSTLEPILAATNFKHSTHVSFPPQHATTKQAPNKDFPQERFTQYVVDKSTDSATQESSLIARTPGKPEPAAIEIHINVSEGFGNESEDLEFLYRQSDFRKFPSKKPSNSNTLALKPFELAPQNETSNEAAEEIVVEIIDGNSNSTENSASRENLNVNPVFTFRSDDDAQVELKNVKYYPEDRPKEGSKPTDDFFVPHLGQQSSDGNKPLMDRDSDTIFYISNTEVKVGESLPTANTYDTQMKKSRLESQFFPANYEERKMVVPQRYEEDIILSPRKNDPLKVIRRPLDISYVGESIMEVEQVTVTTTNSPSIPGSTPDVIIEPAVLPELAIGVPVIGELPPQIELKEIDFMPNFDGNREESSIQYGGDLIDEGGALGVGFDMDSYPLGNMGMGHKSAAISSQTLLNHRVSHLKKDTLTADLAGSSEITDGSDLLRQSNDSINGTIIGEKMGNATAYSVMEEPLSAAGQLDFTDVHTLLLACLATLLPLILSMLLAFGLRHLYRKYHTNPFNVMGRNNSTDPLDAEKGNGGDGDIDGVETPEELHSSSLAFGGATSSPSLEICTNPNQVKGNGSDGDGRNCNGSVSNSRATTSDMDGGDCIQTFIPHDVQEENSTLTVHCNIEAPSMASSKNKPQSTTTTNAAATGPSPPDAIPCNYSGANGSITTMTLKNNHLIVETEERNDISRDTRVTKMHYDNSEKDGVFVVEVSRGADSKIMPGSPTAESADRRHFNIDADVKIVPNQENALLSNHEKVQVHPPPPENQAIHDEMDTNHLHQIDEVDEFEECPRIAKNSNTGLSQSDLSSSSSVDSNKRYTYGNQELYTIEQQDYTTPSPTATKAPHPHAESKHPQPENHNDDNGHPENGHCLEKSPTPAPKRNTSIPPPSNDRVHDMNGHDSVVESKPKITAALLKQDTVVVNEVTNGLSHNNGNEENEPTPHISMENISNGPTSMVKNIADYGANTENGFDSIISLPDPPSTEEIKQMNDIILMETNQLDSLPPPPPPVATAVDNHQHHNGNGSATFGIDQNGDSHSIVSSESPVQTPTKIMKPLVPPTITVADTSAPTSDIPVHSNGNCLTGHAAGIAVEVSGSS